MDHAAKIIVDFLLPMFDGSELSHYHKLDYIFGIGVRHIYRAKALRNFKMPGYYWFRDCQRLPGFSRTAKGGCWMYIRMDEREPFLIDVEFRAFAPGGRSLNWTTFSLTPLQFQSIQKDLSQIEEVCHHREHERNSGRQ